MGNCRRGPDTRKANCLPGHQGIRGRKKPRSKKSFHRQERYRSTIVPAITMVSAGASFFQYKSWMSSALRKMHWPSPPHWKQPSHPECSRQPAQIDRHHLSVQALAQPCDHS